MADNELSRKLQARVNTIEGKEPVKTNQIFNPYSAFPELSRKDIKAYEATFKKYDTDKDGFLDLQELKYLMEKIGHPQTHVSLKQMIAEVDEDNDGVMSFREFLLIFVRATKGELKCDGLTQLAGSVDVQKEGVKGAAGFFEATANKQAQSNKNEEEIKQEQVEKRKEREEAKQRKDAFKEKAAMFK